MRSWIDRVLISDEYGFVVKRYRITYSIFSINAQSSLNAVIVVNFFLSTARLYAHERRQKKESDDLSFSDSESHGFVSLSPKSSGVVLLPSYADFFRSLAQSASFVKSNHALVMTSKILFASAYFKVYIAVGKYSVFLAVSKLHFSHLTANKSS